MTRTDTDLTSRAGAAALCRTIRDYWARKGRTVQVEPLEYSEDVWGVRSNLVAGMPPIGRG